MAISGLDSLKSRQDTLEENLYSSPTAYAPNTSASRADLGLSTQLASVNKQIEDQKSKDLRATWYGAGTEATDVGSKPDGFIVGGLKTLAKPLNAIAGATQYALGKGTEPTLAGNINKATETGLTFGNIVGQYGANRAVSMPLGFALDVMFDPVNWLTAGTAALIPRVGTGLLKGGLKGAGIKGAAEAATAGLTSSLEKKALTAMKIVPFAQKSEKYSGVMESLGKKAIAGAEKYDTAVGKDVYDKLGKGVFGETSGFIGRNVENILSKTPTGEKIVDFMKYSPATHAKVIQLSDKINELARNKGAVLVSKGDGVHFESIQDFLSPTAKITVPVKVKEGAESAIKMADEVVSFRDEATGLIKPEFAGKIKVRNSKENAISLLETAGEDINFKHLAKAYEVMEFGKTGVKGLDNFITKLKNTTVQDIKELHLGSDVVPEVVKEQPDLVKTWNTFTDVKGNIAASAKGIRADEIKPFNKILTGLEEWTAIMKLAKVAMNVGSHTVAILGNFFMGAMMGLPVYKPAYIKELARAKSFLSGNLSPARFRSMFFDDANSMFDLMQNNPKMFKQTFGIDVSEVSGKLSAEEKIIGAFKKSGFADVKKVMEEAWDRVEVGEVAASRYSDEIISAESGLSAIQKAEIKKAGGGFKTAAETLRETAKKGEVSMPDITSSWGATEINSNKINKLRDYMAKAAEANPSRVDIQAANLLLNKMPNWYERIDQVSKIGATTYMTQVGLTEQELLTISRTVDISKADLLAPVISGGEKLYKLKPLKATEVAMEAYMNYAAMPDFVKVMRAVPIVNAPFYSFQYAMAIKTGKTAVSNPAVFNKIGFLMSEISGARTPEEKAALETKYNAYLNSPTVVKIGGMWNTDVKNFIPYYTMNMFAPSEKNYNDTPQSQFLQGLDKLPVLQSPVGQVIKDYFVQPWVLSGTGQAPQGSFGQPLYPTYDVEGNLIDPSLGTKAAYAGQTLAESVVPGSLGYLGLAAGPVMSPEAISKVPLYGFRSIAQATQGRTSIGATAKEDAVRRTLRSVLSRSGIPAYTLDTTNTLSNNP